MFVYYRRHFVIQPLFIVILMLVQVRMGLLLRAPSMPQDTIVQVREIKTGYDDWHGLMDRCSGIRADTGRLQ